MMSNRYRASSRRCSVLPPARIRSTACVATKRRQNSTNPPVMSNIQGMRGKMSKNCLWHACQALFLGVLLFSIGAVMSTLGFQADGLLDGVGTTSGTTMTPMAVNGTMDTSSPPTTATVSTRSYIYNNESRTPHIRFSKLSYLGPIVMGVGGFIIVATCVLTFEARDSAAKVGPASYTGARIGTATYTNAYRARARSLDVRSVASQTIDEPTSAATTTTSFPALHIFDKKALFETFKKFSRTIRTGSSKEDTFHRSPSAPSLLAGGTTDGPQEADRLTEETEGAVAVTTTASGSRRASVLPKMKFSRHFTSAAGRGQLRQTMSVDCPSSVSISSPFILPSSSLVASTSCSKPRSKNCTGKAVRVTTPQSSITKEDNLGGSSQNLMPTKSCIVNKGRASPISPDGGGGTSRKQSLSDMDAVSQHSGHSRISGCNNSQAQSKAHCGSSSNISKGISKNVPVGNLNVHFQPATVELHLPNGSLNGSMTVLVSPNSKSSSATSLEAVPTSPTSSLGPHTVTMMVRSKSPQKPSHHHHHHHRQHHSSSSSRMDHVVFKSPSTDAPNATASSSSCSSRPKLRTELSCRPILMRQSRVDHSEIVSLPDSDEEEEPEQARTDGRL